MRYCSPCRLRAKDTDDKCSRCGGALRVMGGPPPTGTRTPHYTTTASTPKKQAERPTPQQTRRTESQPAKHATDRPTKTRGAEQPTAPTSETKQPADIQFQLAGLESTVQSSSRRVRLLAVIAGVLALSFVGLLFYLRHSYIMQFAEVEQLEIIHSELHTGTARIRYRPVTAGQIQFVRKGIGRQETLLDFASGPAPDGEFNEFHWTGDIDGSWTLSIRYRDGSALVDKDWKSSDRQSTSNGSGVLAMIGS